MLENLLNDKELATHVSEIRDSRAKDFLISILEHRIEELRDYLEEIGISEDDTAAYRGGIKELRELIDLLK